MTTKNITKNETILIAIAEGCSVAIEISDLTTFAKTLHKIHLVNAKKLYQRYKYAIIIIYLFIFKKKIPFSANLLSEASKLMEKCYNEEGGLQYINHYEIEKGTMMIVKNLELVASLDAVTKRSNITLFDAIDYISITMGARLLKSTIL
ncbi:hypothetical protein BJ944DRAFT_290595 [Cunninghamella echinulata]|nr:hypothetical protein BJ944DRAFT_290595 [Cunninghamella echinulata]